MPKVSRQADDAGIHEQYWFWCPGCKGYHAFTTKSPKTSGWTFNGDVEKPTFSPSLLVWGSRPEERCHLFMKDGKIQFLSDCHHELAGKTVECPEWEGFDKEKG